MKSSTITAGFAGALFVLVIIGVLSHLHMVRATAASRSVLRRHITESEFGELLSLVKDAESGQRGYVITGDEAYLAPYNEALKQIEQKISRLYTLTQDNAVQQQNLRQIEALTKDRLKITKEIVEARSDLGFTAAQQLVQTDRGRRLMGQLRDRITTARQLEISLLEKQITRTEAITKRLTALLVIGGILSFTILLTAFLLLTQEIKSRRKAEQEAVQSAERFRVAQELSPDGFTILRPLRDEQGRIIDFTWVYENATIAGLNGTDPQAVVGRRLLDIIPSHAQSPFHKLYMDVAKSGKPGVLEAPFRGETMPQEKWFRVAVVPIGSDIAILAQDTTERRQAEEALRESQQRFESFMRHLPGAAFIKDLEGKYLYANPELGRIFGRRLEDILGKRDADILPAETALHFQENDRLALKNGSIETVERLRQPDGLEHHSIVSKFSVPGPDDKPAYLGGVAYDITERRKAEEALRESEERFRTLADNISQLAWIADEKGEFFWFNKRAYEYSGTVFAAVKGSGWQTLVHPSQSQQIIAKSNESIRTGTFFEDTVLIRGRDGDYRWFLCRAIPIQDDKGRVIRWFGTATDVHELKQTQQALQESEEKFRMLAENAGAIIGIMQDARIIYANPFAEIASGYTRQELYAIDIPKLIHPEYQKIMMERAQRRQAGEPIESHYEFIMVRKNGEYRWLDFSPIMIYYRGKPAIIGMAFDITDRKKAEAALRESEETFRLMAENARAIVGIVQEERFLYVNPYLEELSGYTRDEVLKMHIGQLVHPENRAQVLDRARRRQAGEKVETHYEFAMLTKSGQKKWLDFSVTAIHYHGQPAIVGIAIDITERRAIEQDLAIYRSQLENKNKELESIIGIVSHDLRAPLVNIQGFSREVKKDCETVDTLLAEVPVAQKTEKQLDKLLHHDIPESLQYIRTSSDAMNKLVVTLVEVARAGLVPTRPERINMNELLVRILESIKIKFKKAEVSYDIMSLPDCFADRTQVTQIFTNLLDNAVKYLDPARPGWICVEGTLQADGALYWIADNGIGISPEEQEKIFEPYYQLKEKRSGGIGMGLVTVKRMVDRNNGKIWVVSEKGKYSIFYVALPKPESD